MGEGRPCTVFLLDDTTVSIKIQPTLTGRELFDLVASQLLLHEKECFGLAWLDEESGLPGWIESDHHRVLETSGFPKGEVKLYFRIRMFIPDFKLLQEVVSLRLFFYHALDLVTRGVVPCSGSLSLKLAALSLQIRVGDFISKSTTRHYLDSMKLVPDKTILEYGSSLEVVSNKIADEYESRKGMPVRLALLEYLEAVEKLSSFGVFFYEVKDKRGMPVRLGVSNEGIGLYYQSSSEPRMISDWTEVGVVSAQKNKVNIEIKPREDAEDVSPLDRSSSAIEAEVTKGHSHAEIAARKNLMKKIRDGTRVEIWTMQNVFAARSLVGTIDLIGEYVGVRARGGKHKLAKSSGFSMRSTAFNNASFHSLNVPPPVEKIASSADMLKDAAVEEDGEDLLEKYERRRAQLTVELQRRRKELKRLDAQEKSYLAEHHHHDSLTAYATYSSLDARLPPTQGTPDGSVRDIDGDTMSLASTFSQSDVDDPSLRSLSLQSTHTSTSSLNRLGHIADHGPPVSSSLHNIADVRQLGGSSSHLPQTNGGDSSHHIDGSPAPTPATSSDHLSLKPHISLESTSPALTPESRRKLAPPPPPRHASLVAPKVAAQRNTPNQSPSITPVGSPRIKPRVIGLVPGPDKTDPSEKSENLSMLGKSSPEASIHPPKESSHSLSEPFSSNSTSLTPAPPTDDLQHELPPPPVPHPRHVAPSIRLFPISPRRASSTSLTSDGSKSSQPTRDSNRTVPVSNGDNLVSVDSFSHSRGALHDRRGEDLHSSNSTSSTNPNPPATIRLWKPSPAPSPIKQHPSSSSVDLRSENDDSNSEDSSSQFHSDRLFDSSDSQPKSGARLFHPPPPSPRRQTFGGSTSSDQIETASNASSSSPNRNNLLFRPVPKPRHPVPLHTLAESFEDASNQHSTMGSPLPKPRSAPHLNSIPNSVDTMSSTTKESPRPVPRRVNPHVDPILILEPADSTQHRVGDSSSESNVHPHISHEMVEKVMAIGLDNITSPPKSDLPPLPPLDPNMMTPIFISLNQDSLSTDGLHVKDPASSSDPSLQKKTPPPLPPRMYARLNPSNSPMLRRRSPGADLSDPRPSPNGQEHCDDEDNGCNAQYGDGDHDYLRSKLEDAPESMV